VNEFYNTLKEEGVNATKKQVKEYLDKQKVNQVFKKPNRDYIPIKCPLGTVGCIQADLLDIRLFKKKAFT